MHGQGLFGDGFIKGLCLFVGLDHEYDTKALILKCGIGDDELQAVSMSNNLAQ